MPPPSDGINIQLIPDNPGLDAVSGRWRSKAVLNAMEGVKRNELFENLRKANNSSTITKKLAALNNMPNVLVKGNQKSAAGHMSQRLPHMAPNASL